MKCSTNLTGTRIPEIPTSCWVWPYMPTALNLRMSARAETADIGGALVSSIQFAGRRMASTRCATNRRHAVCHVKMTQWGAEGLDGRPDRQISNESKTARACKTRTRPVRARRWSTELMGARVRVPLGRRWTRLHLDPSTRNVTPRLRSARHRPPDDPSASQPASYHA
jgi:hypothetical protein